MATNSTPGATFAENVRSEYELGPDEDELVSQIAAEIDLIAALDGLIAESLTTPGSKGQIRLSGAVTEVRHHRTLLAAMLRQLGVSDADAEADGVETRSQKARRAARARWQREGA